MMRRSLPATLSTSQSSVTGPSCLMVHELARGLVVADGLGLPQLGEPAPPFSCASSTRRRSRWSAGYRRAVARRSATTVVSNSRSGSGCGDVAAAGPRGCATPRCARRPRYRTGHPSGPGVQRVGQQQVPCRVDMRLGFGQPVIRDDAFGDVGGHGAASRRDQSGEMEEVFALGAGQSQRPAERLDDLLQGLLARPCSRRVT